MTRTAITCLGLKHDAAAAGASRRAGGVSRWTLSLSGPAPASSAGSSGRCLGVPATSARSSSGRRRGGSSTRAPARKETWRSSEDRQLTYSPASPASHGARARLRTATATRQAGTALAESRRDHGGTRRRRGPAVMLGARDGTAAPRLVQLRSDATEVGEFWLFRGVAEHLGVGDSTRTPSASGRSAWPRPGRAPRLRRPRRRAAPRTARAARPRGDRHTPARRPR